jgi:hypothetical protein
MTIGESLARKLASVTSRKVYPVALPQSASLPAITYKQISGLPYADHSGAIKMQRGRFQIDVYDLTYASTNILMDLIKGALERNVSDWTLSFISNRYDSMDDALYRTTIDVMIDYY